MTRPPPEDRDSSHQPTEHPPAPRSMERILDGFGFGLLPDAAAIMFPTAFAEDQPPRPRHSQPQAFLDARGAASTAWSGTPSEVAEPGCTAVRTAVEA